MSNSVIITPILPDMPAPPVADVGVVVPELAYWYDQPLFGRPRAFMVKERYNPRIQCQLVFNSQAVQLSEKPLIRFSEAALLNRKADGEITIIDENYGVIEFRLPPLLRQNAGVYLVEIGVVADGELIFNNELFCYVERSGFGTAAPGPPNISDIRINLRDSDISENELLNTTMFSLTEIAAAATRAVQLWNELPVSSRSFRYSTINFPHRGLWIDGIKAFLFDAVLEAFRKNRLPYAAGGVQLDDQNKVQEYHAAAGQALQSFREQAINLKAQMNIRRGFAYL